jgi:hypothetical protein
MKRLEIPECGHCKMFFSAAIDYPMSSRSYVTMRVWKCQGCDRVKMISQKEGFKLWDKTWEDPEKRYKYPKAKVDFECLKINPNAPLGIPLDITPSEHSCGCSGGCSGGGCAGSGCGGGCSCP